MEIKRGDEEGESLSSEEPELKAVGIVGLLKVSKLVPL